MKSTLKRIEFYTAEYDPVPLHEGDKELHRYFCDTIRKNIKETEYTIKVEKESNDPKVTIKIVEVNNDYLFGVLGGYNSLGDIELTRIFENEDVIGNEKKENKDYIINYYTFFLFNFTLNRIALLSNSKAPKFPGHFRRFLTENVLSKTPELERIFVAPIKDHNIKTKLKKMGGISSSKMVFHDPSDLVDFHAGLGELFSASQNNLEKATVELKFSTEPITLEQVELMTSDKIEKDFDEFTIEGIDENDDPIVLDLVQRLLTKKITIPIDTTYLRGQNLDLALDHIRTILIQQI